MIEKNEKIEPLALLKEFREQVVLAEARGLPLSMDHILDILNMIIGEFDEKQKTCCAAKAAVAAVAGERWIWVTKCRDCPHIRHSRWEPSHCIDTETIIVKDSEILPYCKLPKTPTRRKAGGQ